MRWKPHVRFGGRAGETYRLKGGKALRPDPYHSPWQRPTNENGNGLIRRYVGKGTNLGVYTADDLRAIEWRINTIPRRVLRWRTAADVFNAAT